MRQSEETVCTSNELSQFYNVEQALGSLTFDRDGWSLRLRHRHFSGSWSSCSVDEFDRLTLGELMDVLDAVAAAWSVREFDQAAGSSARTSRTSSRGPSAAGDAA